MNSTNFTPKILIVDDDPPTRETLTTLLSDGSYELVTATNGTEALTIASELLPDLILLDVMMPVVDGFEVCRRLRADPRLAEVPIIMLTALDDRASRLRGLEAGADDFLNKPFDGSELRTRVRTITRLNRYRRLVDSLTESKRLEAELFRVQRMESIGLLAGGIAHDLNNILAPILMAAELIESRTPDDSTRQTTETIRTNAQRGAALVRQILGFARGKGEGHGEVRVNHLINDMIDFVEQTFPKAIQSERAYDKDLRAVIGDATQLYQVLLNLCVNARDAMSEGGRLRIEGRNVAQTEVPAELPAGDYVVITVSDTGAGIPAEIRDRIFDPLFTTKPEGRGTGLGLATVTRIVQNHRGTIQVSSQPGQGTTFNVYLPAAAESQIGTTVEPELNAPLSGRGELILIADDELAIREMTRQALESLNYSVVTATDGRDALTLFNRHAENIQAVITDVNMPRRDGLSVIEALHLTNLRIPCIVTSGQLDTAKVKRDCDAKGAIFLPKPFTIEQISRALRGALGGSQNSTDHVIADSDHISAVESDRLCSVEKLSEMS
jgi:DNA-binding response OmpR family regulator